MSEVIDIEIGDSDIDATPLDGVMRCGDCAEFISDRQTEKGPSSGTITSVRGNEVIIKHSDHPGEVFAKDKLRVKGEVRYRDGKRKLWILV